VRNAIFVFDPERQDRQEHGMAEKCDEKPLRTGPRSSDFLPPDFFAIGIFAIGFLCLSFCSPFLWLPSGTCRRSFHPANGHELSGLAAWWLPPG
jgi:hypothetical protein